MSNQNQSNAHIVGNFIEILRQRYFIDHSADAKTFITEEYTIISNADNVTNIFLQVRGFLPNLMVYDSDGEELPIMPNIYTRELIQTEIDNTTNENNQRELISLLRNINTHQIFLLWIKLPPNKKLSTNEIRIINLEYNAIKESNATDEIELDIISPQDYSVMYVIKNPEDYDFKTQTIRVRDDFGHMETINSWDNEKQNIMFTSPTYDSTSISARPTVNQQVKLSYSFGGKKSITSFPISILVLLSIAAFGMFFINGCHSNPNCDLGTSIWNDFFIKRIEISLGIIAASLVIPGLIRNTSIRNELKFGFWIPIGITIISLFI